MSLRADGPAGSDHGWSVLDGDVELVPAPISRTLARAIVEMEAALKTCAIKMPSASTGGPSCVCAPCSAARALALMDVARGEAQTRACRSGA